MTPEQERRPMDERGYYDEHKRDDLIDEILAARAEADAERKRAEAWRAIAGELATASEEAAKYLDDLRVIYAKNGMNEIVDGLPGAIQSCETALEAYRAQEAQS